MLIKTAFRCFGGGAPAGNYRVVQKKAMNEKIMIPADQKTHDQFSNLDPPAHERLFKALNKYWAADRDGLLSNDHRERWALYNWTSKTRLFKNVSGIAFLGTLFGSRNDMDSDPFGTSTPVRENSQILYKDPHGHFANTLSFWHYFALFGVPSIVLGL